MNILFDGLEVNIIHDPGHWDGEKGWPAETIVEIVPDERTITVEDLDEWNALEFETVAVATVNGRGTEETIEIKAERMKVSGLNLTYRFE